MALESGDPKNFIHCCLNLKNQFSADEILGDSDRDAMVANHLFFSRMTNIGEVLLRLVSRGVISKTQKEQLVQKTNIEGTEKTIWI